MVHLYSSMRQTTATKHVIIQWAGIFYRKTTRKTLLPAPKRTLQKCIAAHLFFRLRRITVRHTKLVVRHSATTSEARGDKNGFGQENVRQGNIWPPAFLCYAPDSSNRKIVPLQYVRKLIVFAVSLASGIIPRVGWRRWSLVVGSYYSIVKISLLLFPFSIW